MKRKSPARLLLFVLPILSALFSVADLRAESASEMQFRKTVWYRGEIPIVVDYEKGVLEVDGREIPIIVDGDITAEDILSTSPMSRDSWVYLPYERFDIYVDSAFYADNQPALDLFFDRFAPRFDLLEAQTGWSSEKFNGSKLQIYVTQSSGPCWEGWAVPGEAHLGLTGSFSNPDICRRYSYENGTGSYGNMGELGDNWIYMFGILHESLHSINPLPIFSRSWLTEAWSQYYGYNILANYGDINQETTDYNIYHGNSWYNWDGFYYGGLGYITNDYHDTTVEENEIQHSRGYDISAWMLSMLRDTHDLVWDDFYVLLDDNYETLDESFDQSSYDIDMHVIDLFGRTLDMDFETETKPIWGYDGPEGPGWGVRNWTDLDWYADLIPEISLSADTVFVGDTVGVQASIWNNGGVSLDSVSVRFYEGSNLIDEQFVDFPCSTMTPVSMQFAAVAGDYLLSVRVDEDSIKIEKSDANNDATADVTFLTWYCGDADGSGEVDIDDVVYLISYIFSGGPEPNPIEAGDANCSGDVDIDDVVYLIAYIFSGGNEPCDPNGDEVPNC